MKAAAAEKTAREVAAEVVLRTLSGKAFLSEALDDELGRSSLEGRDRALATELSYGVVRLRAALQAELDARMHERSKLDPACGAHLLVAAYQLLALDRVPDYAAVGEAVEAIKRVRGAKLAAFANAVLRRLSREARPFDRVEAARRSLPEWLREELDAAVGAQAVGALLGVGPRGEPLPPHRGLCVRLTPRSPASPDWLEGAVPGRLSSSAYWLPARGDLRRLPEYADGQFVVQEEGAQWAALALGAREGERVLDACAGHGQKSSLIAERLSAGGQLWASDVSAKKLAALEREFDRLRLTQPERAVVDLRRGTGDLPTGFDRVLVDVPCTGTGTLRRRPEVALRLTPSDAQRLADRGFEMACNAARALRPGGRLVYVTCSVLPTECERVAERLGAVEIDAGGRLVPVAFDAEPARALAGSQASAARVAPHLSGTDGYFAASFELRRPG